VAVRTVSIVQGPVISDVHVRFTMQNRVIPECRKPGVVQIRFSSSHVSSILTDVFMMCSRVCGIYRAEVSWCLGSYGRSRCGWHLALYARALNQNRCLISAQPNANALGSRLCESVQSRIDKFASSCGGSDL